MSLLLTCATKTELLAIAPQLKNSFLPEYKVFPLYGQKILACITGIGPINAAFALGQALLAQNNIQAVLNTGLCGSFNLDIAPLGSMVMANKEYWPEYGFWGKNGLNADELGFWQCGTNTQNNHQDDKNILDSLNLTTNFTSLNLQLPNNFAFTKGIAITVAGVTGTLKRARGLQTKYNALTESMEGFAVAFACNRFNLPCAEIRAVSNLVGPRKAKYRAFSMALTNMGKSINSLLGVNIHG